MARRLLATALASAFLTGCGSSDSASSFLADFSPADQGVLVVPVTDCTATFGYDVTGLLMGFSSFGGICGFSQATGLCGDVASSTLVTISALRARNTSPAPSPIGPGTYPISVTGAPTLEPDGSLFIVLAEVTKTDAVCAEPASVPSLTGGTLTISSVTSSAVAGNVDLTLSDGSRFQRSFTLPVCAFTPNVCSILDDSCTTPACCPTSTTCPGAM